MTACLATLLLLIAPSASQAVTIAFSGLVGANGDPMPNPYVESGFSVTPLSGTWLEAHQFGNPIPSIFGRSAAGTVEVKETSSGPFAFSSVDLADAGSGGATYDLSGFLGATPIFSVSGGPLPGSFVTVPSPSGSTIDRLDITMHQAGATYNIENIVVNPVPEPSSVVLLTLGAAIGIWNRRRLFCRKASGLLR
jgi:hypothetical protein